MEIGDFSNELGLLLELAMIDLALLVRKFQLEFTHGVDLAHRGVCDR